MTSVQYVISVMAHVSKIVGHGNVRSGFISNSVTLGFSVSHVSDRLYRVTFLNGFLDEGRVNEAPA